MRRLTYEEVKNFIEIDSNSGCKLISKEYINAKTKMTFICECGIEFESNYDNFKNGKQQCNKCGIQIRTDKRTKSNEKFKREVYDLTKGEYTFLQNYINTETKIRCRHNECSYEYYVKPSGFLSGSRCPKCENPNRNRDTEQFKQEVYKLESNKYEVLGEYKNAHTKVKVRHDKCGYEWDVSPNSFLRGSRCPICSMKDVGEKKAKTNEDFLDELYNLVGDDYIALEEYARSDIKIKMRHNMCGNEWDVAPNNFLNGTRCPQCNESKGEQKVRYCLEDLNINFKQEYTFEDLVGIGGYPLRFDFAILNQDGNLRFLIEYDGEFHFKKYYEEQNFEESQVHDERKNGYCKDNNIPLLRIPYWEFDNIEYVIEAWIHKNIGELN